MGNANTAAVWEFPESDTWNSQKRAYKSALAVRPPQSFELVISFRF
jgi:hypothetical protein